MDKDQQFSQRYIRETHEFRMTNQLPHVTEVAVDLRAMAFACLLSSQKSRKDQTMGVYKVMKIIIIFSPPPFYWLSVKGFISTR